MGGDLGMEEDSILLTKLDPELNLRDNGYRPDTWQLANDVEDEMLGHIDRKRACERICNGEDDGFGLSEELRFVVRLIFHGFHEYFDLMQRQSQGGFSIVQLYQIMRSIGFHDVGIKRVIKKLFRKEIIFKKNIKKYYIIKVRRKLISKEEGEIKMTKNGNGKRDRLRQLDMVEMKSVAKELGCEIKGKRKEEVAKELIDHVGKIPEDEPLGDSMVSWYNVAGRLYDGTAQTLEEARKQEADEKQANAETEKVEAETEDAAEIEVEEQGAESEEGENKAGSEEAEEVEKKVPEKKAIKKVADKKVPGIAPSVEKKISRFSVFACVFGKAKRPMSEKDLVSGCNTRYVEQGGSDNEYQAAKNVQECLKVLGEFGFLEKEGDNFSLKSKT